MKVSIYGIVDGKQKVAGELRLRDSKIVVALNPLFPAGQARSMLDVVLASPVFGLEGNEVTVDSNPEGFLALLHKTYTGSYLRASKIIL